MKISIPFNWCDDLLERVSKDSVGYMYGRLKVDAVGSGWNNVLTLNASRKEMIKYIPKMHKRGFKFNYIFDGTCIDNLEWTRKWQSKTRRFLDWLVKIQVDSITISIPYLAELIRECYPALEIEVSHCAQVDTLSRARRWEELGVDVITLAPDTVNGDFELLKKMRKTLKCQLQVMANEYYLSTSISYNYYSNRSTHLSQEFHRTRNLFSLLGGDNAKFSFGGGNMRQHAWIKPDEVGAYEEAGIERIKLLENSLNTDVIIRMADTYFRLTN